MATRATVKIEGIEFAKMYKHYDGYPSHMMDWLSEFNDEFTLVRGDDPHYKFAQLLRSSTDSKYKLDTSKSTGYGVFPYNAQLDENYEYILHKDGKVTFKEIF